MVAINLQLEENIGNFGDNRLYKRGKKIFNSICNNLSFNIKKIFAETEQKKLQLIDFYLIKM